MPFKFEADWDVTKAWGNAGMVLYSSTVAPCSTCCLTADSSCKTWRHHSTELPLKNLLLCAAGIVESCCHFTSEVAQSRNLRHNSDDAQACHHVRGLAPEASDTHRHGANACNSASESDAHDSVNNWYWELEEMNGKLYNCNKCGIVGELTSGTNQSARFCTSHCACYEAPHRFSQQ